jgi:hypothetical protein
MQHWVRGEFGVATGLEAIGWVRDDSEVKVGTRPGSETPQGAADDSSLASRTRVGAYQ